MTWPLKSAVAMRREVHYGDRIVTCFAERPASLAAMLDRAVGDNPQGEALVCGGTRWTWRDFDRQVAAVAGALRRRGLKPGDRIAMMIGNRPEFVVALFACFRVGAIAVPLSTRYQTPEIAFAVDDCGASMLVFEADFAERLPARGEMPTASHLIAVGDDEASADAEPWSALAVEGSAGFDPDRCREEDTAVILYTSGTTGRPKGAMLSHLNLVNSALVYRHCFEMTAADRSIAAVPLAHVTGLVANILAVVACHGTLIVLPAFKAPALLDLVERERATQTILVPAMYKLCMMTEGMEERDLVSWRIGGFGGAPMPEPTIRALEETLPGLRLMNAYGATETSSPSTIMPADFTRDHLASVGLPVPNCDILVVDEHGVEVPPGTSGEIWIGGPSVVPGYWNRPEANADAFTAGYWHSGDIGMVDEQGFVQVLDRKKDMISRGGLKIYSAEVESVFADCPGVLESAIVGRPCPVLGERVHAFVTVGDPAPCAEGLTRFAAARLSDYKVPETFTLSREPLPRNSNGKIMKRELRQRLDLPE